MEVDRPSRSTEVNPVRSRSVALCVFDLEFNGIHLAQVILKLLQSDYTNHYATRSHFVNTMQSANIFLGQKANRYKIYTRQKDLLHCASTMLYRYKLHSAQNVTDFEYKCMPLLSALVTRPFRKQNVSYPGVGKNVSCCNRREIESYGGVFVLSHWFLELFVDIGDFVLVIRIRSSYSLHFLREKEGDLTQSYDGNPYTNRKSNPLTT